MTELIRTPALPEVADIAIAVIEPSRIAAVLDTRLLDTPAEEHFDDLVQLALTVTGASLATFTIIDASRCYRKAVAGSGLVPGSAVPVYDSPCRLVITADGPLVVDSTELDARLRSVRVVREQGLASLICQPVRGPGGDVVGALLVGDRSPRAWLSSDVRALSTIARSIGSQILVREALTASRGQVRDMGVRLAAAESRRDQLSDALTETRSLARSLQASLLPPALAAIPGADTAAAYLPARASVDVIGDFYDLFPAGDSWCAVIGDVCGNGVGAAKVTALARYTIRTEATQHAEPHAVLRRLHDALRAQQVGRFVTAQVVMLGPDGAGGLAGTLCTAGHEPALIRRADGAVEQVPSGGPLLGVFDDPALASVPLRLAPDDLLLLYTDGITESRPGPGADLFGDRRLAAALADTVGRTADETVEMIIGAAVGYRDGGPDSDDTAVLAIRAGTG